MRSGRALIGAAAIVVLIGLLVAAASLLPRDPPANPAAVRSRLNGRLVVGIDPSYPPFAAIDGKGTLIGYDVDLSNDLASRLGARAEFVGLDVGSIFEGLLQRKFDVIISGVPPYPEYARDLIYSQGYFNAGQVIVAPAASTIAGPADLRGTIAVEIGTPGELEARRIAGRQGATVVTYPSLQAAIAAVADGSAQAAILDRVSAAVALVPAVKITGSPITVEPYVIVARRADVALLVQIDAALTAMRADGTLARLDSQWLKPAN